MDLPYIGLLVRNLRRSPRAENLETAALMTLSVAVIVSAAFSGHLWTLAVIYLIPERAAMFVLAGGSTGYPTTTWKTPNARTAIARPATASARSGS